MNRAKLEGKTTRLAQRPSRSTEEREALKEAFTSEKTEYRNSTFSLETSDINWLSDIVREVNRRARRKTNKSEIVRAGLAQLMGKPPEEIIRLLNEL